MKNRGITLGFTPTLYGPNAPVTRLQMAAFMYRLGFQNAYLRGGNEFGTTAVLGTNDMFPLEIHSGGERVMRYVPNPAGPNLIGGHPFNRASPETIVGATIAGGGSNAQPNQVTDDWTTISGGRTNFAGKNGGVGDGRYASVGGGYVNSAFGFASTIAGGSENRASGVVSTVAGGNNNIASGTYSNIAGGAGNAAGGDWSTVTGGASNTAAGVASTVLGGTSNYAGGNLSVVMGYRAIATANAAGSFVFADSTDANFTSFAPNEFVVRASGGIGFYSSADASTYCALFTGSGSWSCVSSKDVKDDFAPVDKRAVLEKVAALPISSWRFKAEPAKVRHIGPFAQDFHASFGLGTDDQTISSSDIQGVALAAIQGLNAKVEQLRAAKDAEIVELRDANEVLRRAVEALRARLDLPTHAVTTK